MKKLVFIIFFLITTQSLGQTITVSSGWTASVLASSYTEAGSNYTANVSSATNQSLVSISGFSFNSSYTVRIHKSDIDWDSSLILSARRRTNGTGGSTGTINGVTSYIALSNSPQVFYSGNMGNATSRTNVAVQYRIGGRSLLLPAKTYQTTVVYTVSN
ncbi:MAG: hypothetical protein U0V04_14325 [Spirosomataceae bacterium]|jgi:hypothetical protein